MVVILKIVYHNKPQVYFKFDQTLGRVDWDEGRGLPQSVVSLMKFSKAVFRLGSPVSEQILAPVALGTDVLAREWPAFIP